MANSIEKLVDELTAQTEREAARDVLAKTPLTLAEAKELLDNNFLGPDLWEKAFGITLTDIPAIPFSRADVEADCPFSPVHVKERSVARSHVLVYVPDIIDGSPYTISRLAELLLNLKIPERRVTLLEGRPDREAITDLARPEFHQTKGNWHLIYPHALPGLPDETTDIRRSYKEQELLLTRCLSYRETDVVSLVTALYMYYIQHGRTRLLKHEMGFCSSPLNTDNEHLMVGEFDSSGVGMAYVDSNEPVGNGILVEIKPTLQL